MWINIQYKYNNFRSFIWVSDTQMSLMLFYAYIDMKQFWHWHHFISIPVQIQFDWLITLNWGVCNSEFWSTWFWNLWNLGLILRLLNLFLWFMCTKLGFVDHVISQKSTKYLRINTEIMIPDSVISTLRIPMFQQWKQVIPRAIDVTRNSSRPLTLSYQIL